MTTMWSATFFAPLVLFAFSMSATPGPNNVMLTASGANFGFRRTIPHMLGINLGFLTLMAVTALGLGIAFVRFPLLQQALRVAGSVYLLYLAWRIATAAPRTEGNGLNGRPFRFWEAAAFQYVNPKAWIIAISGVSTFTLAGEHYALSAATVCLTCTVVNLPSISFWAAFGAAVGRLLRSHRSWRIFNVTMGVLTASCVILIFIQ